MVKPTAHFEKGEKKFYGNLVDILQEETGFQVVRPIGRPLTKHPIWVVEKDGREYAMKFNFDNPYICSDNNILQEASYLKLFRDISGVVNYVTSGRIKTDRRFNQHEDGGNYVNYVIKELLPGPSLSEVDSITPEMKKQMLETMDQIHQYGILYEREVRRSDFVLDEKGRPILVDLEYMRQADPSIIKRQKIEDKLHLLKEVIRDNSVGGRLELYLEAAKYLKEVCQGGLLHVTGAALLVYGLAPVALHSCQDAHGMFQEPNYLATFTMTGIGALLLGLSYKMRT